MKELYNDLMELCLDDDTKFFNVDHKTTRGTNVRIFSYHIANYTDWLRPNAKESRGIMFEMDDLGNPVRIMSRPMEKFYNLYENPFTMELDLTKILYYMTKEDGSLISTFLDGDMLLLKSKGSISSLQARQATVYLYNGHQADLLALCLDYAEQGATVNMEWCSPDNRIVLPYTESTLRILNVRMNDTGEYIDTAVLLQNATVRKYMTGVFEAPTDPEQWVLDTKAETGVEGYVAVMPDIRFKIKTDWYSALHHTKDSINSNKRLLLACTENATDDLRGMFSTDQLALDKINAFELAYTDEVSRAYKLLVDSWNEYRHLDRKGYAIAMSKVFKRDMHYFHVVMGMFTSYSQSQIIEKVIEVIKKYPEKTIPKKYKEV